MSINPNQERLARMGGGSAVVIPRVNKVGKPSSDKQPFMNIKFFRRIYQNIFLPTIETEGKNILWNVAFNEFL